MNVRAPPRVPSSTSVSFLNTGKRSVSILLERERLRFVERIADRVALLYTTSGLTWIDDMKIRSGWTPDGYVERWESMKSNGMELDWLIWDDWEPGMNVVGIGRTVDQSLLAANRPPCHQQQVIKMSDVQMTDKAPRSSVYQTS